MLIRWATTEERKRFNYVDFDEYDVLIIIDRMTSKVLGIVGFSRETKIIGEPQIFAPKREFEVKEKLLFCADRQCNPKGRSFHYRYDDYARTSQEEHCPCCNAEPMPNGNKDIAELEYSWVTAERVAQGRLFGAESVLTYLPTTKFPE